MVINVIDSLISKYGVLVVKDEAVAIWLAMILHNHSFICSIAENESLYGQHCES
jgi:hypothetical protein